MIVMLLSILSADAVALPLSPAFPTSELKYVLDNSEAVMLLATETCSLKAREVLNSDLLNSLSCDIRSDLGNEPVTNTATELEDVDENHLQGGVILYTSGTTSRPVSPFTRLSFNLLQYGCMSNRVIERSSDPPISNNYASKITYKSMELHTKRSSSPSSTFTPHPWNCQHLTNTLSGGVCH